MRILHVGLPNSVHLARWIDTVAEQGWEHHLFPVNTFAPCSELSGVTLHYPASDQPIDPHPGVTILNGPSRTLAETIRAVAPDVVHAHGIQLAGYPMMDAKAASAGPLPAWIVSCWGSDIYLFGTEFEHVKRIRAVLESADCYVADNRRDIRLARGFGLRGEAVKVGSVAGGFDLEKLAPYRQQGPTSARRTIMVKGRNVWVYRGRVALEALLRNADLLRGYHVAVYADQEGLMRDMVDQLAALPDVEAELLPHVLYEEILQSHGRARLSISLSVSDGTNLSFLEAIALGSFPIQSERSATIEWATHGETAMFVAAEDVDEVAEAIRQALTDDALVDGATAINASAVEARLAMSQVRAEAIALYEGVVTRAATRRQPPVLQRTAISSDADASPGGTAAPAVEREAETARPVESARPTVPQAPGDQGPQAAPSHDPAPRVDRRFPLVTIITPTYNRADMLPETVDSILQQDYPNIEYIVLDDGSTDDTQALLQRYGDAIRWEYHPNMGQPRTVNRGFELAQGEIITVISSDDPLLPGAISALVKALQDHPDVLAIYPDWNVVDERGKIQNHVDTFEYEYLDMVRYHHTYPGPCTLFRRSVVERIGGYDPSFRYVPDYDFYLRAGLLGPFRRLPQTLATYRSHPGAITSAARGVAMAREHIRVIDKLYERDDLPADVLDVKTEAYRNAHCVAAIVCEAGTPRPNERFRLGDTLFQRRRTSSAPTARGQQGRSPSTSAQPFAAPEQPSAEATSGQPAADLGPLPPRPGISVVAAVYDRLSAYPPIARLKHAMGWDVPRQYRVPRRNPIAASYDLVSASRLGRIKGSVPIEWRTAIRRCLSKAGR